MVISTKNLYFRRLNRILKENAALLIVIAQQQQQQKNQNGCWVETKLSVGTTLMRWFSIGTTWGIPDPMWTDDVL